MSKGVFPTRSNLPLTTVHVIPIYLLFSGGALSAFGDGMYYFLIPTLEMAIGPMMSYVLVGQLLLAVVASHFSWFDFEFLCKGVF